MVALAAPQNAAVLPGAWLYNGDQSRKPYYAIEEVSKTLWCMIRKMIWHKKVEDRYFRFDFPIFISGK